MLEIIFKFFTYLLAIYGLSMLIIQGFQGIYKRINICDEKIEAVLLVKDCEDIIEGVLRDSYARGLTQNLILNKRITIIDMGSKDKTLDILNKLKKKNEGLSILEKREREKVFQYFNEILDKK